MVSNAFSIRDTKLSVFSQPVFENSVISATRALQIEAKNPNSKFYHFPEDFELVELGTFDDITGRFTPHDQPKFIISLQSIRNTLDAIESLKNDPKMVKKDK